MLALNIPRDIVKPNADAVSVLARVGTLAALKESQLAERRSDRASCGQRMPLARLYSPAESSLQPR